MSFESTCVTVPDTFDAIGVSQRSLDVEIYAEYRPGWRGITADDPGEVAEFNVLNVRVTAMYGGECLNDFALREDHEDWFVWLDKIALAWAIENYDDLIHQWLEVLEDGS